jgi:16S rRNA (cytidine1402-2'-O)-methyltransferase
MPALFVVATPIGNLEDITLRAVRVLKEVKLIAAEDTRQTRKLLVHYGIRTPTTSYHQHNKLTKLDYILERLQTEDVALVSDAGTPGISDPGFELIAAVHAEGIPVIPIPGPSVLVSSLVVSALPADSFTFLGFLPHRSAERKRFLTSAADEPRTLVLFESPHRLPASLADLRLILGDRRICVCREMTKLHEEIFYGTISEAEGHFLNPRGEFTLVIAGKPPPEKTGADEQVERRLKLMLRSGARAREAVAKVALDTGLSRKELYRDWLKLKKMALS